MACGHGSPAMLGPWGRRPELAAFAKLTPLRHAGRARSGSRTACAGPRALRFSAATRGPPTANSRTARTATSASFPGCWQLGCWLFALRSCRAAQRLGARAQRASTSGPGRPFKRRERSERSAFRPAAPSREQHRASPAAGRGQRSGRVFFAYFLAHEQESRSPAGAKSRRGLSIRTEQAFSCRHLSPHLS